jgi:hypothetical protein
MKNIVDANDGKSREPGQNKNHSYLSDNKAMVMKRGEKETMASLNAQIQMIPVQSMVEAINGRSACLIIPKEGIASNHEEVMAEEWVAALYAKADEELILVDVAMVDVANNKGNVPMKQMLMLGVLQQKGQTSNTSFQGNMDNNQHHFNMIGWSQDGDQYYVPL